MRIKALALISGGLDSLLAARLIQDQGCEVIGLHFNIPFCKSDIKKIFPDIGIRIVEVDLGGEFLGLIRKPHYGFGSNMNPCIDCKILMFSKARQLLAELGAEFIITGEVLGQRPMSQNKQALKLIKEKSGLNGLLLRPLSAKFFDPTIPEIKGWVKRENLLNINGRSRQEQMRLARDFGFLKYSAPAGGCLLTDPCFSNRLKDLLMHDELNLDNLELLKVGRHLRLADNLRLVVGRNEAENNLLIRLARNSDYILSPQEDLAGPTALIRGQVSKENISLSAQITASYCDDENSGQIKIFIRKIPEEARQEYAARYIPKNNFAHLLI